MTRVFGKNLNLEISSFLIRVLDIRERIVLSKVTICKSSIPLHVGSSLIWFRLWKFSRIWLDMNLIKFVTLFLCDLHTLQWQIERILWLRISWLWEGMRILFIIERMVRVSRFVQKIQKLVHVTLSWTRECVIIWLQPVF